MKPFKKKFIVDERNRKVAVQIDYATYIKMEELLENYGLFQLMQENEDEQVPQGRQSAGGRTGRRSRVAPACGAVPGVIQLDGRFLSAGIGF